MSENKQEPSDEEREGDTELHCVMGETTSVLLHREKGGWVITPAYERKVPVEYTGNYISPTA